MRLRKKKAASPRSGFFEIEKNRLRAIRPGTLELHRR